MDLQLQSRCAGHVLQRLRRDRGYKKPEDSPEWRPTDADYEFVVVYACEYVDLFSSRLFALPPTGAEKQQEALSLIQFCCGKFSITYSGDEATARLVNALVSVSRSQARINARFGKYAKMVAKALWWGIKSVVKTSLPAPL